MTDIPLLPSEEDDALAGEYVLGVLPLAERLEVEERLKADTGFAARVATWERHFAAFDAEFAEVAPPPEVFARVESRLFPKPSPTRSGWRMWFGGALAAAVVALGVLVLVPPDRPGEVIASLGAAEAPLIYEARHDGARLLVARLAGDPAPAGQTHELWVIAPDAAPVSLGLLGADPLVIEYPRPPAGWVLAVSVEPAGGSPTGAPTGPVILTAELGA